MKKKMMAAFPTAQWETLQIPTNPNPQSFRCFIPFEDVAAYSDKYLKAQKAATRFPRRPPLEPTPPFLRSAKFPRPFGSADIVPPIMV